MKAEKFANSIMFVRYKAPRLSMGYVLSIVELNWVFYVASCIFILLFVLGC